MQAGCDRTPAPLLARAQIPGVCTLSASVCMGSNVYSTLIRFALISFQVTAINFALLWPLRVTACARHLFLTTAGICCPRARASPLQLGCAQGQKAAGRCPCCSVFCPLRPKPRPFLPWVSFRHSPVLYKDGIYGVPAPLSGLAGACGALEGFMFGLRAARLRFHSIIQLTGR